MCQLTCDRKLHLPTLTPFPLDWCDTTVDCKLPWSPQGGWVPPGSRGQPWHTDNSKGNWVQNIGVHTLNVINLSWAINPTWQLTCTFHLDNLWCPKLCFRFLCMQDTACKTRREVVPTPGKRFYTLHEISAQEYYCARGSTGQYCHTRVYCDTQSVSLIMSTT